MQRILLLLVMGVLCATTAMAQNNDFEKKSKAELIAFIKENFETHANFMGIDYKVEYDPIEP